MRDTRSTITGTTAAGRKTSSVASLVQRFESIFGSGAELRATAKKGDPAKYVSDSDLAAERIRSHGSTDSEYSHMSGSTPNRTESLRVFTQGAKKHQPSADASVSMSEATVKINSDGVTPRKHKSPTGSDPSLATAISKSRESLYEAVSSTINVVQQHPKRPSGIARLATAFMRQMSGGHMGASRPAITNRPANFNRPADITIYTSNNDTHRPRPASMTQSVPTVRKMIVAGNGSNLARIQSVPQQPDTRTARYDEEVDKFEKEMLATIEAAFHTVEKRVPDTPDAIHSAHWEGCQSAKRMERMAPVRVRK
eukprot:comp23556_c0_seq1/m.39783 comp23556_c0_seq1/g.39783  ORF comp23556_c0_seq1/g.39783 comp23556_c0_seq1/m.39783 type:complete len:311 (-) comp23556_c0_seq1:492-1424(-)